MKELHNGFLCLADYCDKELVEGQPPCCECQHIISFEEYAAIQEMIKDNFNKKQHCLDIGTVNIL